LKNGGICVLSTPFIYREHPSENLDFFRYTRGGIKYLANNNGFQVIKIVSFSFVGTAIASLINQFIIRQIFERGYLSKFLFILICPFFSLFSNIIGLIIDLIYRDERFAARYHIVLRRL
jgi:hypothetical protein